MAINFLNDIDLNQNEAVHLVLENQANDTAAGTGIDGQLYYDTTNKQVKFYNATTSAWVALGTSSSAGTVTTVSASTAGDALDVTVTNATTTPALAFTWAGSSSQYVDGEGNLITFPTIPQGDVTAVVASSTNAYLGITVANSTGPIPEVGIDIGSRTALSSPADTDELLILDVSGAGTNKKITVANLLAGAPQGDITGVTGDNGITVSSGTGPVPNVSIDYAGSDSVIGSASDGTSITLVDADDFIFADDSDSGDVKYGNLSQLKTYIGAGTYSWTVAGDSGSSAVASGDTVTIGGSTGIDTSESSKTVTIDLKLSELSTVTTIDPAADFLVGVDGTANEKILYQNVHLNQWGSAEANVNLNSNKLVNVLDPTNDQDAATKAYVDSAVTGLVDFKGGFDADGGAIDGGGNLTSGGSRVAIAVGDMYVVTGAGNFYGNASYPLTVGDSVICKTAAVAGASVVGDWTIVQGDEGVVNFTNAYGTYITGTSNTNARGAVSMGTIDLSASDGTSSTSTRFLSKDNTWDVPSYTADTTYDFLCAQNGGSNNNPLLRLDPSSGSNDDVTLTGGSGVTITRNSNTEVTVGLTSGSTGSWSGNLSGSTSGISNGTPGSGGYTTFTLTTATLFGVATNSRQVQVEVMQIAANDPSSNTPAYTTVYPAVSRAAATTIEIKFKGTIANDKYYAVLTHAGSN